MVTYLAANAMALEEEDHLKELQRQFERLLTKEGRLGLAAASRAILTRFREKEHAIRE